MSAVQPPDFRRRPDSGLSMRFFTLGVLGLLLLLAATALDPGALRWPLPPHGVLLLHLAVLGWITPVMVGADYQLIPVVLGLPLPAPRAAEAVFWLYTAGVTVFLSGWAVGWPAGIALGGAAAGCALLGFAAHAGSALVRLRRWGPTALGLGGGLAFLVATAVAGPYMALSIGAFVPGGAFQAARAVHVASGFGGWMLLTIMGATYQLVPFFAAAGPEPRPRFGAAAPLCAGTGAALLLASGVVADVPPAIGLAVIGAGVALWIYDLGRLARRGRQTRREPVVTYSLAGVGALAVGGATATLAWGPVGSRLAMAGVVLGLLAGPALLILGQLQKIAPFLAALDAALVAGRRGPAPKTEALFPRRRAFAFLWVLGPALAAEVAGLVAGALPLVRLGALGLLAAVLGYAVIQARSLAVWRAARRPPS